MSENETGTVVVEETVTAVAEEPRPEGTEGDGGDAGTDTPASAE